ncbi:MAG TPA: alanine racemase [Solirubrobacteraceae bacterium]|nr:alanine racemase [Solirubrobacteraceae bacterium]
MLRALARIDLAATERNVTRLCARLGGGTALCAVVKARASGHGAAPVARAALAAGAGSLAVATAGEAAELREQGIPVEVPVLVLGAVSAEELPVALGARGELVAWDPAFARAVERAWRRRGDPEVPVRVHVKYDTGLGRLGTRDLRQALDVAEYAASADGLVLHGAMTHCATADEDQEFLAVQLEAFRVFVERMRAIGPVIAHAANSAATLVAPASHFDMVRCGIALHGCDPMNESPDVWSLEPVLSLSSYAAAVKPLAPGESVGYGRRFIAERDTWIATVPIGYADGIARAHTNNGEVLIAGRRYPIVGTVSMDNLTVDLGPDTEVTVGDEVVLIGRSGAERITAEEVARRIGTINHEVLCRLGERVTRRWHRDGEPV